MGKDWDWAKLVVSWIAAVGGYVTEHLTIGKVALVATVVLTLLQIYKTWLDILQKRQVLREKRDDPV